MDKSATIGELAKALAKAQSEMKPAKKDSENPFFKSRYADLESVWDACREALNHNGLSITQTVGFTVGAGPILITTLLHVSGEWIQGAQPLVPNDRTVKDEKGNPITVRPGPQELAAAITYARRKGVAAMVGVIEEDDDVETAHGRANNQFPREAAPHSVLSKQNQTASSGSNIHTCGNTMMVSKFEPNMYYCGKCKQKVPMAPPQVKNDEPLFDDDIPPFEPPGYLK